MALQREADLIEALVATSETLVTDFDLEDFLDGLVNNCVRLLEVTSAGILMPDDNSNVFVIASSDNRTELLELFQLDLASGPCLDTLRSGQLLQVPDLQAAQARWPQWYRQAAALGVRSVAAVPMRRPEVVIGSLNLFLSRTGGLSPEDVRVAQALADIATIGILQNRVLASKEELAQQLQMALTSRVSIEQAKGMLAERSKTDTGTAWRALRSYARAHNMRVSEVAVGFMTGSIELSIGPTV